MSVGTPPTPLILTDPSIKISTTGASLGPQGTGLRRVARRANARHRGHDRGHVLRLGRLPRHDEVEPARDARAELRRERDRGRA